MESVASFNVTKAGRAYVVNVDNLHPDGKSMLFHVDSGASVTKRIEPYVAYGYPNRKTISDLIYKRGFAKIKHSRIPLSDRFSFNKF